MHTAEFIEWQAEQLGKKQAEIDKLQRKIKLIEALRDNQFELLIQITEQRNSSQAKLIELQKRIDEALEAFEDGSFNYCQSILKGNQNEN